MDTDLKVEMDLHTASGLGDKDLVMEIIKSEKVCVNKKNAHGWTPLMYACWGNHEAVVNQLLDAGASIAELNNNSQSPLLLATKAGNVKIVKLTFQKHLLNHTDDSEKTALYCAVEFNFLDIAAYLIEEGADVNISCKGVSALKVAEENGQKPMAKLLLENGARKHLINPHNLIAHQEFTDLQSLLQSLSLEKYWPVFEKQDVDLNTFLQLNEEDLKSLGVNLLGPRRKLSIAISALKKPQTFS